MKAERESSQSLNQSNEAELDDCNLVVLFKH